MGLTQQQIRAKKAVALRARSRANTSLCDSQSANSEVHATTKDNHSKKIIAKVANGHEVRDSTSLITGNY